MANSWFQSIKQTYKQLKKIQINYSHQIFTDKLEPLNEQYDKLNWINTVFLNNSKLQIDWKSETL